MMKTFFSRPNTVYNQMGLLLKSILCVSRVLPAYKFARRQGPDTHVMCYRIFAGEPNSNPLGKDYQTACVSKKLRKICSKSLVNMCVLTLFLTSCRLVK